MTVARVLILGAVLSTFGLAAIPAQTRRPPRRPIPNLNGPWESDEEGIVTVFQSGNTIRVLTQRPCVGAQRPFYLMGTLSTPDEGGVMTITNGIMIRCENQDPIIQTCCGPRDTWQTTFRAQVVGDYSITGTRAGEYWTAKKRDDGSIDPATCKKEDREFSFVLLRQSPTATPPATPNPTGTPGAGPTPNPTPEYDFFDEEKFQDLWKDTKEWVEDIPDRIGWTESWEEFKNDPGVQRFTNHDEEHTD